MSKKAAFSFSPAFQEEMLALMARDLGFAIKAIGYIPVERLYSEAHKYLFEQFKKIIKSRSAVPSYIEIEDGLKEVEPTKRRMLKSFCKQIYEITPADPEFIKEKCTEYARRSSFIEIFQDAQTLWNSGKHDGAYSRSMEGFNNLYSISFHDDANIMIEDFEEHRQRYLLESAFHTPKIPTNIAELDKVLSGGLEKGELGILLAEPKKGKCYCAASNIILGDGSTMTLGEIVKRKEHKVLSFNIDSGEFEKDEIVDWIESGEKPVFDLKTTSSISRLTGSHPLLTLHGWEPLQNLKPKDCIFVPRRLPHGSERSISKERLTLLAYMLADGSMNKAWSWSKKEDAMINEFEACHAKEFVPKIFSHSQCHRPSVQMRSWFRKLGLIGCLAGTKFIPPVVELQDKIGVAHFLNKLFTCDGSAEASGKISYCSKSHRMISQVQSLLLRFSIASSLRSKIVDGETYYEIAMQGINAIRFKKEIGMSHHKGEQLAAIEIEESDREYVGFSSEIWELIWSETDSAGFTRRKLWEVMTGRIASDRAHHFKQGRVSLDLLIKINNVLGSTALQKVIDGEWIMTTIQSIEPAGTEMTYDIEVKKNHNFVAENTIVHNSIGLVHFGAQAIMMRFGRVAHFVLEGTTDQAIFRYESRLTGIPYNRLAKDDVSEEESKRLDDLRRKYRGRLEMIPMNKHWSYTVLDIESKLKEMQRAGKMPDLVVVDYGDLLKSAMPMREKRHEQTEVFRDLKRLAVMEKVAIWTASQAVRPKEDPDKEYLLRAKDIAENYEKVRIADLICTLNQTLKEKGDGILRLHIDTYRSNDHGKTVRMLVDFSRMIFHSKRYGTLDLHGWMKTRGRRI